MPGSLTVEAPSQAPVFTFDQDAHRYYLDGVEIPHVTGILRTVGLAQEYGGFHEAQWRGLHVHQACELLDLNDLDWSTVYPQWAGYVRAYERFKQEREFVPRLIEYQAWHPSFRFAGTIDREGVLEESGRTELVQLDLKTGAEEDWHKWQTAGYYLLRGVTEARRGCLYLNEDRSYRLVWHDDPADMRVFLAALTITHTKRSLE